jgi:hypothetical protein
MAEPEQPGEGDSVEGKVVGAASSQERRHQGEGQQRQEEHYQYLAAPW